MDHVEPMDIDSIDGDYEDKENSKLHSNVFSRTPCTERGYEELDISELNMKLRYSITPASSPMSKSFTANSKDHTNIDDKNVSVAGDNACLTSSFNSTLTNNDSCKRVFPLQTLPTDHLNDSNRNVLVCRSLDNVIDNNITITIGDHEDENFSTPSTSSSIPHTPEATTPTKELPKDGGSPIMRGIRSVLSIFRSSQSPIPSHEQSSQGCHMHVSTSNTHDDELYPIEVSTPLTKTNRSSPRRNSPLKDSLVFKDDLEKELQWKDESTILFKEDKIPKHKLFLQETVASNLETKLLCKSKTECNKTLEHMDISYNDSTLNDKTMTDKESRASSNIEASALESDSEFVDCEATYSKVDIVSFNETTEMEFKTSKSYNNKSNISDHITSSIQNFNYEENNYSLNAAVPTECIQTFHSKGENILSEGILNRSVNKKVLNVSNDNNVHEHSLIINNNVLKFTDNEYEALLLTEVAANSDLYLSESKEGVFGIKSNDKINSAIKNSSIVENNYSLNSTVPIGSCDTSLVREEDNGVLNRSVNKEVFHVNNVSYDNSLSFTVNQATVNTASVDVGIDSSLHISHTKEKEQILLQGTFISTESDTNHVDKIDVSYIKDNSFLPENKIDIENNILDQSISHTEKSEEIKVTDTLDDIKIEVNKAAAMEANIKRRESHTSPILECAQEDVSSNAELSCNIENKKSELFKDILTLDGTIVEETITGVIDDKIEKRDSENSNLECTKEDVITKAELNGNIEKRKSELFTDILSLGGTIVEEQYPEVVDDNIVNWEHDDTKHILALDDTMVKENLIAPIHDDSVSNVEKADNRNSTTEVLGKPVQFDCDPKVSDEIKSIDCNKNYNFSVTDESNQIDILNTEATNLSSNRSNMINITSENDQENTDSFLYNENRYFRMSIDTEMPELKIIENTIETNEFNKGHQFNFNDNISSQNVMSYKDNVSELDDTNIISSNLGNTDCPNNTFKKIKNLNDQEKTFVQNICSDITKSNNQHVELPVHIPLPSDSEAEENNIEDHCKTGTLYCVNGKPKIIEENKYNIINSTSIETDSVFKQKVEINNPNFKSIGDTEIMKDLNSSNMLKPNNAFVDKNAANVKCSVLQNKESDKSGIINDIKKRVIDDLNQDKNQITTNVHLPSLTIIDNSEAIQHVRTTTFRDFPLDINNSNLGSDIREDSGNATLKEDLNQFATQVNLQSPPLSPLLSKIGYDLNFDNINDPFATKTKIRLSPTPEHPPNVQALPIQETNFVKNDFKPKRTTPKNKRKSQQLRKSGHAENNATYVDNFGNNDIGKSDTKDENLKTPTPIADELQQNRVSVFTKSDIGNENQEQNTNKSIKSKCINVSLNTTEPSDVKDISKSVFNCPEISDINYSSFSNKEKNEFPLTQISIPYFNTDTQKGFDNSSHTLITAEVESIQNEGKNEEGPTSKASNETFVSRNTDSDITQEVNTEDEDTATFIEMEELIEQDNLERLSQEKLMTEIQIQDTAIDSENIDNGELFIDAEAFEFLLNQNKSNIIAESGKESLFLKFDPLFAKRFSSDSIIAALKKVQNKQSTPKKVTKPQLDEMSNMAGPSKLETTFDDGSDDASFLAMSKPMMVVNPAVNPIVSPRKAITPKINRQSLTFTSPAMAVIDRLLSLSGNNPVVDQNRSLPSRQPSETDVAITQLREMLADKDIHVHNLRSESKDLKDRLSSLEVQVKTLETESADRLRKINDLSETLIEKTKMNKSMAIVVEEYERTIASLITQMEQEKKNNSEERIMLIKERDEQTAHLASMEVSFSDLHSKYEKSKQIIYSMKSNEDTLRKSIKEFEESLVKMQNNYELLKQHATSKLNHANQELEKFNRAHEAEILKLNALIKRKELHITSLEETLAQKTKANEELTAICDELINKVG